MEIKRLVSNVINTLGASGANVNDDTTAEQYCICTNNALSTLVPILPPVPYGKTKSLVIVNSQTEQVQYNTLDAFNGTDGTKETIVAGQRYRVEIGNPDQKYETKPWGLKVFSYTAPAVLSGNAATDRANVYTALAAKINAYSRLGATAGVIHSVTFTLGAVEPTVDTVVTQGTSSVTGRIVKVTLTGGTWAGSNAAGTVYISFMSDPDAVLSTNVAWTWAGGGTLTQTNATLVKATGLAVRDDVGYYTSFKGRGGINDVISTQGFSTNSFVVSRAGRYAIGIGSVYASLGAMQYDHSKQDLLEGDVDLELINSGAFDAAKTYRKYVMEIEDGDVDTRAFSSIASGRRHVVWVDESNGTNLGTFDTAIKAAVIK